MNKILWQPSPQNIQQSRMDHFRRSLCRDKALILDSYADLHRWSIENPAAFWGYLFQYFNIISTGAAEQVVDDIHRMPGAEWFKGCQLNFAENLLRFKGGRIAIMFFGEDQVRKEISFDDLYAQVQQTAAAFRQAGLKTGDRVAGFMPNLPETVVAMLAAASLGAVWSSCSPDFGIEGVLDRFSQIEPSILIAADGYIYKGKKFDSLKKIESIIHKLPSVRKTVIVRYIHQGNISDIPNSIEWNEFIQDKNSPLEFVPVPFSHPLYIMYSSGTTGKPKSIVHSAGGTLLQHLKELALHTDISEGDTVFYFTTCGWMMWNWLVSSLALGATIVLYDGNPFYPGPEALPDMADRCGFTVFGTSAKYIASLEAAGVYPGETHSFQRLKCILSTGSPLTEESFDFVYRHWKQDITLSSISGGTDIISCFALGNPVLPVYRGELQCIGLGMDVASLDDSGREQIDVKGELVCRQAFPSMPVFFWNDPDGSRYHKAYFDHFPNIWRHGDYITINDHGGVKIFGRSDATLNPGGVRIGTAEIYRVVEALPEIEDSVVVGQKVDDDERVLLFIKLNDDYIFNNQLQDRIRSAILSGCSPRHVPALILPVQGVPYTINGKKVEIAVKKLIHGQDVTNKDALANPEALEEYKNLHIE